jgi:hypothetical protein
VGIRVNNDIGHYFQTQKGLRQAEDTLAILFAVLKKMVRWRASSHI